MSDGRVRHWKGKIPHEDFIAQMMYEINENGKETNRLLARLVGDDGKRNHSNKRK